MDVAHDWDGRADEYQREHGSRLRGAAWGSWQIDEEELNVLGDVADKDILELGCGAAQWSIALSQRGARCVGLDTSARQLEHARAAGADFPLVHAPAEAVPLADQSFDIVFSDYGALSWGDPNRVMPEAARLLRPGGLLAFSVTSPFRVLCWDDEEHREGRSLRRAYVDAVRNNEPPFGVTYPYGGWVRLLVANGLDLKDLVELRAPSPEASTSFGYDAAWSHDWPGENIWVAEKRGPVPLRAPS